MFNQKSGLEPKMGGNNVRKRRFDYSLDFVREIKDFLLPFCDKVDPFDIVSTIYLKLFGFLEMLIERFWGVIL